MQAGMVRSLILNKLLLLIIIGTTAGVITSAGIFAFVTVIGVLTRLAIRTGTADHISLYEDITVVGVVFGNILSIFHLKIPVGVVGLIFFGFFSGCYIGSLAVALEEVLQVFPIITHRMKLKAGVPVLIVILALGKLVGALYHLLL